MFNNAFQMQGVVDSFVSLIWHREYYKTGTFELHLNLPEDADDAYDLVNLLQKGNFIVKDDSLDEAGYIDHIELDDKENETLVVTGYFIQNLISQRIVWGQHNKSGLVEDVLKYFVDINCITVSNANRVIPNLVLSTSTGISIQANETAAFKNLEELMEQLAQKYDVGWRTTFDLTNHQYVFDVYQGKDRSINQTVNPQTIFSLEFENVMDQVFTDSNDSYRNMALVGGPGDDLSRKLVSVNDNLSGFDRRELFVDGSSVTNPIQNDDGTTTTLSDADYNALLASTGNGKLSENPVIQTFEAEISVTSNLVYKTDFDLGDIVSVKNDRWGILLSTRIVSVDETYENDALSIKVGFGTNIPTIIDRIKQRTR